MNRRELLYFFGRPFAPLYGATMVMRELLYAQKVFRSFSFPVPVISVGNLTMGGTGKTPMVAMLASQLLAMGYRPAIISRGYGGTASAQVNVVSTGKEIVLSAREAGDEPYLLASSLPGVPILTGKERVFPARRAIIDHGANLLLLDDGFQHMAVQRDINIVLFSAATLAGNSRVFPGGDLREPVKALNRADIFVLTGVTENTSARASAFQALLEKRFPHIPVCQTGYSPPALCNRKGDRVDDSCRNGKAVAFSGIANPERFHATLDALGITPESNHSFRDHIDYGRSEILRIRKMITDCQPDYLVTTLKDLVKLKSVDFEVPLYYLSNETEPAAPLLDLIRFRLEKYQEKRP